MLFLLHELETGIYFQITRIRDIFQTPSSESFFEAAKDALPPDLGTMKGLDWMRSYALLAHYGIQVGKIPIMHRYLGIYHSIVSMDGLNDEKNWPEGIGIVEIELRRRLVSYFRCTIIFRTLTNCSSGQCTPSKSTPPSSGVASFAVENPNPTSPILAK